MAQHELKTVAPHFEQVWKGLKTFEVRENDRDFKVGDTLILKEYDAETRHYSCREIKAEVTHILSDSFKGVSYGYVVMSIKVKSLYPLIT